MPKFKVWDPDHGTEEECEPREVNAYDAESAATDYADLHHSDDDYPKERILCVRDGDTVRRFTVTAEPSVTFYANEVPRADSD